MSSSPVVSGGSAVESVQIECQGDSFVAALDRATGETRWRIERPRVRGAWCSPTIVPAQGERGELLILQDPEGCSAHDPTTGQQLWSYKQECEAIPSPLGLNDLVFVPSQAADARSPAGDQHGRSDVDVEQARPGQCQPGGVRRQGVRVEFGGRGVVRLDRRRRDSLAGPRGRGAFEGRSTPVLADGHLYCVDRDELTSVVRLTGRARERSSRATSSGEPIFASPAVADDADPSTGSDPHLWKVAGPR